MRVSQLPRCNNITYNHPKPQFVDSKLSTVLRIRKAQLTLVPSLDRLFPNKHLYDWFSIVLQRPLLLQR